MSEQVFIPKLGQTVEEVTLIRWLVGDGTLVSQGQPILDVETDKAVFTVEAKTSGYLHLGPFKEGDIVPVLTVVAVIGQPNEIFQLPGEQAFGQILQAHDTEKNIGANLESVPGGENVHTKLFVSPRARRLAHENDVNLSQIKPSGEGGLRIVERDVVAYLHQRPMVTPLAQKMAVEAGLDLQQVPGSGPRGRITKADVQKAMKAFAILAEGPPQQQLEEEVLTRVPLRGIRGIIAERMAASVQATARVSLFMEVDATEFVDLRARLKSRFADQWGFYPEYNDLFIRIVALALRRFPYMNARLADDHIENLSHINLGIAVDTERGLLVPVIRDADKKNLEQIGSELRNLYQKALEGKLLPDELTGGTFTVTNLGMYDVLAFTPVINLPEAAILGVGKISPAFSLRQGQVVEYQKLVLSLVFDHRLVDGAPAARFLQFIKELIEDPGLVLAV